jgi:BASS family bile acid:Na+ symporter
MNAVATVVKLVLEVSIFLTELTLGLRSRPEDVLYLFRHPGQLLRALFAMEFVMPLVAVLLAARFDLHPAVKVALVALAVSPVPPLLPKRQMRAGGTASYVVGLLFAAALVAVALAPPMIGAIGRAFGRPVDVPTALVGRLVAFTVLVPLAIGVLFRSRWPNAAERLVRPIARAAGLLLILAAVPLLVASLPSVLELVGNGTIVAIVAFAVAGLAIGHLFGGPETETRGTLALATAARHPGVAIALGAAVFPAGQKLVMAAVLLDLILTALVSLPYSAWVKRRLELAEPVGA